MWENLTLKFILRKILNAFKGILLLQGPHKEFQTTGATFHFMMSGLNYTMGINIIYLFYLSLRVSHKYMHSFASVANKNFFMFLVFLSNYYPKIANMIKKIEIN